MTEAEKGVGLAVLAHLVWGGMAVYFGESLEMIGPNLREVKPTIFLQKTKIKAYLSIWILKK